jgi:hypothetical protein
MAELRAGQRPAVTDKSLCDVSARQTQTTSRAQNRDIIGSGEFKVFIIFVVKLFK